MNKKFYIAVFIFLMMSASVEINAAPAGGLDRTFGTNGSVMTPVGGSTNLINAIAIQPDGKIIAVGSAGSMAVLRYSSNGALDTSFNGGGRAVDTPGDALGVAIQADGKIVVVGNNGDP